MQTELPLSSPQLGIWYSQKMGLPVNAYNIGQYTKISGAIDVSIFADALKTVVAESETLRVSFTERNGSPFQLIALALDWEPQFIDCSGEVDADSIVEEWMRDEMARPLDLYTGPFFTFVLFKTGHEQFVWYFRAHHLILDGFGGWLIATRVAHIYSLLASGSVTDPSPFGSLITLVEEEAKYKLSSNFEADRVFWRNAMSGFAEAPTLGVSRSVETSKVLRQAGAILPAVIARLELVAKQLQITLPQILTLAAVIFVHRLTGSEDVLLGQFSSARMSPASRRTPAMVSNVLPLRLEIRSGVTLDTLVQEFRRGVRAQIRHFRYNIVDLRRDLRRVDRRIFRQIINVQPADYDLRFADAGSKTHTLSTGPVDDLAIHVICERAETSAWRLEFEGNSAFYDQDQLGQLHLKFLRLLAVMKGHSEPVGQLDILPAAERNQALTTWNQTKFNYPRDRKVHELFEEQALRTPHSTALVFGTQSLSYQELNDRAEQHACKLLELGVKPNSLVGLYVERSLEMVVGILAILKSGGAFVPLDPSYPPERIAFILEDSRPLALLTLRSLPSELSFDETKVIRLDSAPPASINKAIGRLANGGPRGELAYVLYTSGSTGRPKGVQIPHVALVNFFYSMKREPGIAPEDKLLAVSSLSFDISNLELLLPLVVGAQVAIAPADVAADGGRLAALIDSFGATIVQATPVTWRLLLEAGWKGNRGCKVLCGGEAWPHELAGALLPMCASLWNMYGPTETTIWSSVAKIERDQPVRIGLPIANTKFYVLDADLRLVPVGVPGELCISGDGVALGYLNRPDLTAERFVADPFTDARDVRMYRTGDRVRQFPDGRLEYLGRLDQQIKVRGYRIEPGEIEVFLRRHPHVLDAVVVAKPHLNGESQLIAYVTAKRVEDAPVLGLREFLRRGLPAYMIPSVCVTLDSFPLTPNGKIDRKHLPSPDEQAFHDCSNTYDPPSTPREEILAQLWIECLRLERVGRQDNFFDLGGDSLAMLRLSLEIERLMEQKFPLPWIHEAPTLAEMAKILDGLTSASDYSPTILLRPGSGHPVFMVHPIGGSIMQLVPVARSFPGTCPVYGIVAKGFDGAEAPEDRVEAMADAYVNAITLVQPHGPYFLVGMCFGGLVAMEIARRLFERGERIQLLAFLDTYPHQRYWRLGVRLWYFGVRVKENVFPSLRAGTRIDAIRYVAARLRAASRKGAAWLSNKQTITAPEEPRTKVQAVYDAGIVALANYRPSYYPGRVDYLMCGYHSYIPNGPRLAWEKLIENLNIEIAPVLMKPEFTAAWLFDRIRCLRTELPARSGPIK